MEISTQDTGTGKTGGSFSKQSPTYDYFDSALDVLKTIRREFDQVADAPGQKPAVTVLCQAQSEALDKVISSVRDDLRDAPANKSAAEVQGIAATLIRKKLTSIQSAFEKESAATDPRVGKIANALESVKLKF